METNLWATGRRITLDKTNGRSVFLGKADDGSYKLEFTSVQDGMVFVRTCVRLSKEAIDALVLLCQVSDLPDSEVDRIPDADKKIMYFTVTNSEWTKAEPLKNDGE